MHSNATLVGLLDPDRNPKPKPNLNPNINTTYIGRTNWTQTLRMHFTNAHCQIHSEAGSRSKD